MTTKALQQQYKGNTANTRPVTEMIRMSKWHEYAAWPTKGLWLHLSRASAVNGLDEYEVIHRIGPKTYFIHIDNFNRWLAERAGKGGPLYASK